MQNQFELTDDQVAIQDMARKFTADAITPFAAEWDEQSHYPVDVWKAAGALGFGALSVLHCQKYRSSTRPYCG